MEKQNFLGRLKKDLIYNKLLYCMVLPAVAYFAVFSILPLFGITFAFTDYSLARGLSGSKWVGLKHFIYIFTEPYILTILKNTLVFSLLDILFCFPAPILLALLLSSAKNKVFNRTIKTAVYMPYFISMVIVCGMISQFTSSKGLFGSLFTSAGWLTKGMSMLSDPGMFRGIIVSTNLWQQLGFNSVIFVAAIAGIDPTLYEAASVEGASSRKQLMYVTIPGILPTIVMLLILKISSVLNVGFEKIYLLYNPTTYKVADVISTYVYRLGVEGNQQGLTTAVGLLNSIIGFGLLVGANTVSKKFTERSLY
jgi:putative aldouronate transport system permease protein